MITSVHNHYVLPARVVHVGLFALLISILLNCAGTFVQMQGSRVQSPTNYMWTHSGANRLPVNARTVALEVVDSDRYGMHDDNDWASVFPLGHGFVKGGDDEEFYAVSMYHQMHCLNSFRRMFNGQRNASRAEHDGMHAIHCLSYLRQMVLCNADTTLEPAFTAQNTDGRKTKAAYGTGVTHQCSDWVQIRRYAEGNYALWKDEGTEFVTSEISAINE